MRVILIVLDSVGIGELSDADLYGDVGSNTLLNIKKAIPNMNLKNMLAMWLSNIDGAAALADTPVTNPTAAYCKLAEKSKGKDTTVGHWEIAGLVTEKPMPTYPNGFPEERIGRITCIFSPILPATISDNTHYVNFFGSRVARKPPVGAPKLDFMALIRYEMG